jgi:hypothetical protein
MHTSFREWLKLREGTHKYAPEIYQQIIALAKQNDPPLSVTQIATQLNVSPQTVNNFLFRNLTPEDKNFRKSVQPSLQKIGMQRNWTDPAYREKMTQITNDPAYKEKMAKLQQDRWATPAYREKMMALFQSPEERAKRPQWSNYWKWLASFPLEKRQQIIKAQMLSHPDWDEERKNSVYATMLAKAAALDDTPPNPATATS